MNKIDLAAEKQFDDIENLDINNCINKARVTYNSECLRCRAINKEMIIVGALVFCNDCYSSVFKTEDPVKEESELYYAWLVIARSRPC